MSVVPGAAAGSSSGATPPPEQGGPLAGETTTPVTAADTPPTSADLAFNNDTLPTQSLRGLAQSLKYNPEAEFLFVRNTIVFDPYFGSMKGAYDTLATAAGNDVDQANLLIALLRLSQVPARYVEGQVVLPATQVENWIGFSPANGSSSQAGVHAEQAARVLSMAKIPFTLGYNRSLSLNFDITHFWVEAYLNSSWIEMDPSFKVYSYYTPLNYSSFLDLPKGAFVSANQSDADEFESYVAESLSNYLSQNPDAYVGNVTGAGNIINATSYTMPKQAVVQRTISSLDDAERWFLKVDLPEYDAASGQFSFQTEYSVSLPSTLLSTAPLFLYAQANSSTQDYIQSFPGGVYNTSIDLSGVDMRPTLLLNGQVVLEGVLCPILSSMPVNFEVLLNGTELSSGTANSPVGEYDTFYVSSGHNWSAKDYVFADALSQYGAAADTFESGNPVQLDRLLGERSFAVGRMYFALLDSLTGLMERDLNLVQLSGLSVARLGFALSGGSNGGKMTSGFYGGGFIDIRMNGYTAGIPFSNSSETSRAFNWVAGGVSSALEGYLMAETNIGSPISTTWALMYAQDHGIPIETVTQANFSSAMSTLRLPQNYMQQLASFLQSGDYVTLPTELLNTTEVRVRVSTISQPSIPPATTWKGTGWIAYDPATLIGSYWILGYLPSKTGVVSPLAIDGGNSGTNEGVSSAGTALTSEPGTDVGECSAVRGAPHGGGVPAQGSQSNSCFSNQLAPDWLKSVAPPYKWGPVTYTGSSLDLYDHIALKTGTFGDVSQQMAWDMTNTYLSASRSGTWQASLWFEYPMSGGFANGGAAGFSISIPFGSGSSKNRIQEPRLRSESPQQGSSAAADPGIDITVLSAAGASSGLQLSPQAPSLLFTPYFSGAGTDPEELDLYELAPGPYQVILTNSNSTTATAYLGLDLSGVTNQTVVPLSVQVPAHSRMSMPLRLSYSNGKLAVTTGEFEPASSLHLGSVAPAVLGAPMMINGTLYGDMGNNSLSSKSVQISSRPVGSTGSWALLGSAVTGPDGSFFIRFVPSTLAPIAIRASFSGDASNSGSADTVIARADATLNITAVERSGPTTVLPGVRFGVSGQNGLSITTESGPDGVASFKLESGEYQLRAPSSNLTGPGSRLAFSTWEPGSAGNMTVDLNSDLGVDAVFAQQYYVTLASTPAPGGSVSGPSGWYDSGAQVSATGVPTTGWEFAIWNGTGDGSYSGGGSTAAMVVNAPLTEVAVFYPGLAITAPSEVSISYQYGNTSGSVGAGTSRTVFAPAGTTITVTGTPTSFIYTFNGWSGATNSSGVTATLALNSPSSLRANYGISYEILAGGLGAVVLVVVLVAILVTRRRHPSVVSVPTTAPSAGQGPGVSGPPASYCRFCGQPISSKAAFCNQCGKRVR